MSGATSVLCGCHSPVGRWVCSPVVGVEAPRSVSEPWWELDRTGVLALGEEPLSIPLSPGKCALWCCLSPVVWAHRVHRFCCCPWLHVSPGNSGSWPGCPSASVLAELLVQIRWCGTPRSGVSTAVVVRSRLPWGLWGQPPPQPCLCARALSQPAPHLPQPRTHQ